MSESEELLRQGVERLLADFVPESESSQTAEIQQAIFLARLLQECASTLQTPEERKQQVELDRMIHDPHDKATLTQMTDQAFRSGVPSRAADQLIHILDVQGIPRFFSPLDRTLLRGFQSFGSYLPGVAMPLVQEKMQHETANVILPAEPDLLGEHLQRRRDAGLRMNVNHLGEALLGEQEAARRLASYREALARKEIEVISVKISTLYSQISPLARQHTIQVLCDRLESLYRTAAEHTFERADGSRVPKFVYLDMEEYRDMSITAEAFMRTLDRPGLEQVAAGIALQAYIPDSHDTQQRLLEWARRRVASGGAPPTLRIVKGANMEMERVEASLRGWPQAPFKTKPETDANFKRMLRLGMRPENLQAMRLGVASHNLFDLAYGLVLAARGGELAQVQFEMLEGMASHQRRALRALTQNVLLYAPACTKEDFIHAIGYLVRRLDENTGPDNFLRHAFMIQVEAPEWTRLEQGFVQSFDRIDRLSDAPRRRQDRRRLPKLDAADPSEVASDWQNFTNEPDTDFSLPHHSQWAEQIIEQWRDRSGQQAEDIPLIVAGQSVAGQGTPRESFDPSRPGVVVARYRQADHDDAQRAVAAARADDDGWRSRSAAERREVLRRAAHELRMSRASLMGAALAEAGKTLPESDAEVSEAVDFAEFYGRCGSYFEERDNTRGRGRGVVVVVSPWNFPIAIPCGGVAAALATGNTVILKPASDTVLVAYHLCQCFWRAGVSQRTLQLLPCPGATVGQQLATHPDVDTVILTGGTETAVTMLSHKPNMRLLAETGGKNATIVTALADRDQAIRHVLHSAYSHSGQKCSATSLLILEGEVYDDPKFKAVLCDAVESLPVGSAWDLSSTMGPLIRPPSGKLQQSLTELLPGESWAVESRMLDDNPHLVTPAVKWDVQPGSETHCNEFFGPVLGVMRAENLTHAIDLVNATGYGLTSGLESLDDREQQLWLTSIRAGNLYINRPTTGAIVLRQPFGGMGKSAIGVGIKAGGPNYVTQLMEFDESQPTTATAPSTEDLSTDTALSDDRLSQLRSELHVLVDSGGPWPAEELRRVIAAISSYDQLMREEFGATHDHFRLIGEDNVRRYLPVDKMRIRIDGGDSLFDILARVSAATAAGCHITISYSAGSCPADVLTLLEQWTRAAGEPMELVEETDEQLAHLLVERQTDRVRYAHSHRVPRVVREAVCTSGIYIADAPVHADGRIELLWYVEEQSISTSYHRYGNLGERAGEQRAEPL